MNEVKQDHQAHGELGFFGTRSRMAARMEEAITPTLNMFNLVKAAADHK